MPYTHTYVHTYIQGLLNVGLQFTEASRGSFLTQLSVVLTPVVSLFAGQKVSDTGIYISYTYIHTHYMYIYIYIYIYILLIRVSYSSITRHVTLYICN